MGSKPWTSNSSINNNEIQKHFNCPGIKEIIDYVEKLKQQINDQEKIIQSNNKTVVELQKTKNNLILKDVTYHKKIEEAKLEVNIQRDVNKQIRSTMQSLQNKYDDLCKVLENERGTVQKLEEELFLRKINQEAVMKKQLEKLKQQFKRIITSFEKEQNVERSEDVSDLSKAQNTDVKVKNKNRNKKKGYINETL